MIMKANVIKANKSYLLVAILAVCAVALLSFAVVHTSMDCLDFVFVGCSLILTMCATIWALSIDHVEV